MSRYFLVISVQCLLLFALQSAVAQKSKLQLRLDTVAPASQVRKLVFSEDGKRLYSAGKDKVVRTWTIVERNGKYKLVAGHKFRWGVSRGARGHIYDIEISKQGLLAIAGFSAWGDVTDIFVYDLKSRELKKKLFPTTTKKAVVRDLAFSPSGKHLAAITEHGEIRLWDVDQWKETVLQAPSKQIQKFRALHFQSEQQLVSTEAIGGEEVKLAVRNLPTKTSQSLGFSYNAVVEIEPLKAGTLAVADNNGQVLIWPQGKKGIRLRGIAKSADRSLTAMTVAQEQYVIVALTDRQTQTGASIEYWDTSTRKPLEKVTFSKTHPIWAMGVSPNGDLAAVSGGEQNEIRLVKLVESATGKRIAKPFSQPPAARVAGEGIRNWKVACNPDPNSFEVGLTTEVGSNSASMSFDPANSKVVDKTIELKDWRTGESDSGDFSARFSKDKDFVQVYKGEVLQGAINLELKSQGPARSHCWIAQEGQPPVALAIGTANQSGIFVYDLRKDGGGYLSLLRYFRDHEGTVTSLATTADRRYLVSTSKDQTCKFWSLEGLLARSSKFPRIAGWGAVISRLDDQTLKVDKALKSGIAHARSLPTGTRIVRVQASIGGKYYDVKKAAEMLDVINRNPIWQTLMVYRRSPGSDESTKVPITPAWEPMLTSFFSQKGQWAAWTPFGYYNSSPQGDELFGWQLTPHNKSEQLKFFRADQFRSKFEKPEAIKRLLSEGNIDDALAAAASSPKTQQIPESIPKPTVAAVAAKPDKTKIAAADTSAEKGKLKPSVAAGQLASKPKVSFNIKPETKPKAIPDVKPEPVAKIDDPKVKLDTKAKPKPATVAKEAPKVAIPPPRPIHKAIADQAPGIRILTPYNGEEVIGEELLVEVQLTIPKPAKVDDYEIRGTLGSAFLHEEPRKEVSTTPKGSLLVCQWSIPMPEDGFKELIVSASNKTNGDSFSDLLTFETINSEPTTDKPKLFFVGLAADLYIGDDLGLDYSVIDVQTVLDRLPEVTAKHYQFQDEVFLENHEISRDLFEADVNEIVEDIQSASSHDDLLIVYIAGHGAARGGEYFFVPPDPSMTNTRELYENCDTFGVPWNQIARLTNTGCKTIFILDTCFAGDVLAGAKARTRPLISNRAVVLSSSEAGQLAYEDENLKHGVFSYCLLQALDMMADENEDNTVDLDELIAYIQQEVPIRSLSVIKRGASQALASARGSGATLQVQKPVSSTNNLGILPIASPTKK